MLRRSLVLLLCLVAVFPVSSGRAADGELHTAGIYVDFGNGETAMALVPFAGEQVSGIDLLKHSGLPVLTVGFGGFGDGVCMIETTGCDVSSCRRTMCQEGDRNSPFWQFMTLSESGNWVFSPLGASAYKVQDGDLSAWVWAGTAPELPELTLDDIRMNTGAPQGDTPAVFTSYDASGSDDDGLRQILVGGGMIGVAVLAGGGLILLRKRQHATR